MTAVRRLLQYRALAAWLIAAALLMKMLVPAGWMTDSSGGAFAIELCSGYGPATSVAAEPPMATHGHHHEHGADHGKAEQPCAFAGLAAPALGGADPVVLALAIAFIIAAVFRIAAVTTPRAPVFLRPPLRGPPSFS